MNLLISPISKSGEKKVGIKVTGANSRFLELFKSFEFEGRVKSIDNEFSYFFHFCGELRSVLIGTEYKTIELTDGFDVQERNYYIDYSKSPVKVICEDKFGFPIDETAGGKKRIKYKKASGEVKYYTIEKEIERTEFEMKAVIEGGGYRHFKVDNILEEEEI